MASRSSGERGKMQDCTADFTRDVHVSRTNLQKIEAQFVASACCSQTCKELDFAKTTVCLTEALRSNAGRRKMRGCTDGITLGLLENRASLQKKFKFFASSVCSHAHDGVPHLLLPLKNNLSREQRRSWYTTFRNSFYEFTLRRSRTHGIEWTQSRAKSKRSP